MAEDPHIQQSEEAKMDAERAAKAANLFDLRRLIGGLFIIYGVILTVLGLGESDASIEKSADININLYAGLAMLVFGLLFVAWALMRPLSAELRGGGRRVRGRRRWRRRGGRRRRGSSASTAPPKPPPIMRAPAAPARLSRSTVASTSGTDAS